MPRFHITASIRNLDPPPAPLRIRGITLEQGRKPELDEETARRLLSEASIAPADVAYISWAVQNLRLSAMGCVMHTEVEANDIDAALERGEQMIQQVIMAIELITRKAVAITGSTVRPPEFGGAVTSFAPRTGYRGGPASVDAALVQRIEEVATVLDTKPSKRVETAMLEYDTALKSDDVRRQFIHGVVALEALFGDESTEALSYKVPLRAVHLIPSLRGRRSEGFGELRQFYRLRSKFVHGTWDANTLAEAKGLVDELTGVTAEAVLEFLSRFRDGRSTDFPDLDEELFFA